MRKDGFSKGCDLLRLSRLWEGKFFARGLQMMCMRNDYIQSTWLDYLTCLTIAKMLLMKSSKSLNFKRALFKKRVQSICFRYFHDIKINQLILFVQGRRGSKKRRVPRIAVSSDALSWLVVYRQKHWSRQPGTDKNTIYTRNSRASSFIQ